MKTINSVIIMGIAAIIGIAGLLHIFGESESIIMTIVVKPVGVAELYVACKLIERVKTSYQSTKSNCNGENN